MKRLFLLVAMAIALAQSLRAQDDTVITVGDSTSSSEITAPVFFNWNNSYTQSIYLASELEAGGIVSISYYYPESTPKDAPSVIYMAEVSAGTSSFSSTSDWVPASSLTEVYSGNVTFTHGWNTIELTAPFPYSGEGNLVVAYVSNRTSYQNLQFASMTTSGTRTLVAYSDDYACDPATIGSYYGNKISKTEVPVTRFVMGDISGFCFGPGNLLVSDITANEAVVSWTANESSTLFALEYRKIGQSEWTEVSGITDTEYTLNGLDPFAMYEVKVYAVCSEGNSTEAQTTFRTLYDESSFLEFPYSETFDDFENFSGWQFQNGQNGWYLGTAVNNTTDENGDPTEGGALYISNDGGTTNAYTYDAASYSYAYSLVNIPEEGETVIKFDWRNNAEECCDYLNVYLLPLDQELSSSSLPSGSLTGNLNQSSTWQTHSIVLPSSYAGNSYKLVFAWRNDSSVGNNPPAAVDNIEIYTAPCASVEDVSIERMEDGATASVQITVEDSRNENAEYVVEYRLYGTDEWLSETSASPVVLSDLVYRSLYEMKITAQCGEDLSLTSDVIYFSTSCIAYDEFPATESFEVGVNVSNNPIGNQAAPLCWNNINAGSSSYYFYRSSSQATTGTVSLAYSGVYSPTSTAAFSDWMITPVYSLTGGEMATFNLANMSTTQSYAPASVDVLICNVDDEDIATTADTSRFELVATITHTDLTTNTFMHQEVNLSEYTGNHRLALAVRRPSRSFLIDDFAVETAPDCPTVYGVQVQLASQTGASVDFSTANGAGNGWIIAYGTAESAEGFDPAAAANTQAVEADAEFPILVEGLEAGTIYYFAVQQNCGGEFSEVVSLSVPSVNTLPYTENFNDPENVTGWAFQSNNTVNGWYIGAAANNPTGEENDQTETGGALYVSNDGGTTVSYTHTSTSAFAYTFLDIEAAAEYNVSFDYSVNGESGFDDFSVYLVPLSESTLDNTTYRIVNNTSLQTSWAHMSVAVSGVNFAPGLYRLVFKWRNDGGGGNPPSAAIDNISVTASPCGSVQSITAQAVVPETVNDLPSAVVDFTDANGDDITYVLRYKASSDSEWTEVTDLTREDFPYTIPDLAYQTTYQIGMAVACSEGELTDYTTATVTTTCMYVTVPWSETFDSDPFTCWYNKSGALPETGIVLASSLSNGSRWYYNTTTALDGITSGKIIQNVYSTYNGWAISPLVYLEEGTTYQISFDVAVTDYGHPENVPDPAPDDKFAMLVSLDGGTTWDVANGLVFADGDEDTEHNYSDLTNSISRYAYRLVDADENPISGLVRFAFYGGSTIDNGDNDLFIDNVSVEEYSDCQTPYALVAHTASTSATVTFGSITGGSDWEYVLVEGSGEDVDLSSATPVYFSSEDLSLPLDNLTTETTYTLAIRSACGGNTYSDWSAPVSFTTYPVFPEVPYTCDFEAENNNDWTLKNGTCTNQWHIGAPTGSTSGNTLFVSDDGVGATYDVDAPSVVIAELSVQTGTSDSLTISFDLSVSGEIDGYSYYDYLKVFYAPASTDFAATSLANTGFASTNYSQDVVMSNGTGDNYVMCMLEGTQNMSVTVPNPYNEVKKLIFVWNNDDMMGTGVSAVIDNVSIVAAGETTEPDPCDAPTGLAVSGVTRTGATVTWNGSASGYEVRLNGGTAESVTATTKTYTDLTASTSYTVEVRSVCTDNNSAWVSTTFTTLDDEVVVTPPTVATLAATNVTFNGATLNGTITAGSEPITAQGFMYKAAAAADWTMVNATGETISATLSELAAETAYEFKAFATTATATTEGSVMTFTTAAAPIEIIAPTVTTEVASDVTYNAATLNGTIVAGNEAITAQGFMYKAASAADWTTVNATGETISATLSDLTAETAYEFKAFATTATATTEGSVMTFTTEAAPIEVIAPTVTTMAATSVTSDGATLNGTIVAGNEEITAQGFMYKQDGAADWTTEQVSGENIAHTLTGLSAATTYRFKAFATTESGTVEGAEMSFTTLAGLSDAENASISAVIYPNPASERATLSLNGLNETAQIVLTDVQGRIILTDSLNAGAKTYELNVKNLASGVYYVRVIAGNTIATKKLIVE